MSAGYYQTSLNIRHGAEARGTTPEVTASVPMFLPVVFKAILVDFSNHYWPPNNTDD